MESATLRSDTTARAAAAAPLLPPSPPAPKPIRWLARAVDWAIVSIGAVMATLVFANVISHNVFHSDVVFTTELCELLMVWVTFLGAASATRRGSHMVVGELIDRLGTQNRRYADAAIQGVVLLTLGLLAWYGVGITEAGLMSQLTVLEWPMATQYAALPVASVITMVFVIWDLVCIAHSDTREQRYGRHAEGAPQ